MLSLTRQERFVLLFLAALMLFGVCLSYCLKKIPAARQFYDCASLAKISAPLSIDINKANQEELMRLPGVGESLAAKIIHYREVNGRIRDIEELKNIDGIKERKLEVLRKYVIIK